MIKITLPDGNVREYEQGTTAHQIALSISEGLARNVLAAEVNGQVWDSSRPIQSDSIVKLLTWNDQDGKATFWHSSAHLMAEALEALYPGTKFGIGPAIETGFYYDVDFEFRRSFHCHGDHEGTGGVLSASVGPTFSHLCGSVCGYAQSDDLLLANNYCCSYTRVSL